MTQPPFPPDPRQPPTRPQQPLPQGPPTPAAYPPYLPPQPPPMHPEERTFYRRSNRIMARHEWTTLWWPLILGALFFGLVLVFFAWNAIFG